MKVVLRRNKNKISFKVLLTSKYKNLRKYLTIKITLVRNNSIDIIVLYIASSFSLQRLFSLQKKVIA